MKSLNLNYVGRDSWDRPVYECGSKLFVDVDPRSDHPDICTKSDNNFDGEPDYPISRDINVVFIPKRDRW